MAAAEIVEKEGSLRISAQIDMLEEETVRCRKQLKKMEASLNSSDTSKDEKVDIRKQVQEMKNELSLKEKRLTYLHKENKKTTLFAVLLFSLAVIAYVIIKSTKVFSDS